MRSECCACLCQQLYRCTDSKAISTESKMGRSKTCSSHRGSGSVMMSKSCTTHDPVTKTAFPTKPPRITKYKFQSPSPSHPPFAHIDVSTTVETITITIIETRTIASQIPTPSYWPQSSFRHVCACRRESYLGVEKLLNIFLSLCSPHKFAAIMPVRSKFKDEHPFGKSSGTRLIRLSRQALIPCWIG